MTSRHLKWSYSSPANLCAIVVSTGIIASKRCNDVVIRDNEVYDGGDEAVGIFLHRSSDNALVYDNYIHDMGDAGIAIMESMNGEIYDNVIENVKYGLRISLGGSNNYIHDNTFDGCSKCETGVRQGMWNGSMISS